MNTNCNENPCDHEPCKDLSSNTCGKPIYIQNYHCCCNSDSGDYGEGRIKLTENLEIYVRKDGDDSNDGFTDSADGAFLTINAAIRSLLRFDAQGYAIKIVVHEGEYKEDVVFDLPLGSIGYKTLTLMGYEGETINVMHNTSSITILVRGVKSINVEGLTITVNQNATPTLACFNVTSGGEAYCRNCHFVSTVSVNVVAYATVLSLLAITGNTTVSSNGYAVFGSYSGSSLILSGTIQNKNISFSRYMEVNSYADSSATFTGTATGIRYSVYHNGAINTGGKGANYFPGTIAGIATTGGVYA